MTTTDKTEDNKEFAKDFMAEQQKLADAAGMNVYEYMAQAENDILKETMAKLAGHAQAHPTECPADCTFQISLRKLKEQYGTPV